MSFDMGDGCYQFIVSHQGDFFCGVLCGKPHRESHLRVQREMPER